MSELEEGLDGLQADMAAHQARFRGEVTAEANNRLAVETIQRMERQAADARPAAPAPAHIAPEPIKASTEMVDGTHGRYILDKGPDSPLDTRKASPAQHEYFVHAMARIELLLSKLENGALGQPSWHQRVMAVLGLRLSSLDYTRASRHDVAADLDGRYVLELTRLLDESSAKFGDWRADAPTKISVAVRDGIAR